jgi:aryl-alcohol dehydrogenase-like predicted oxidoreductase
MRTLPDGKAISALGFGCSSLWAKASFDEVRAQEVLEAAILGGISHFDTSPSYGQGLAEQRLGRFLADRDATRLVISTKVGNNLVGDQIERGFSYDAMTASFEGSLKRLGLQRVDVVYLHGPSLAEMTSGDVLRFFEHQKRAGRIGYSGVESRLSEVIAAVGNTPHDAVMPHFHVAHHGMAECLQKLSDAGKIVISGTVLAQMQFDWRTFFPKDRRSTWYLARLLKSDPLFWCKAPRLAKRLQATGLSPREAAIAFVLRHPAVTSGLFGSSNPEHVTANAAAGQALAGSTGS